MKWKVAPTAIEEVDCATDARIRDEGDPEEQGQDRLALLPADRVPDAIAD